MTHFEITGCSTAHIRSGDIVRMGDGRLAIVLFAGRTTLSMRYLTRWERLCRWARGLVNLNGFWGRVWER